MPADIHSFKNAASTASLIYIVNRAFILLIQRNHEPFVGMWALPGGFLNCDQESLEEAAIREFFEETNLTILKSDIELFSVQSDPKRDPRGHVIDHVYAVYKCKGDAKAKDDAQDLKFFPLEDLPDIAFDHAKVIQCFLESNIFLNM